AAYGEADVAPRKVAAHAAPVPQHHRAGGRVERLHGPDEGEDRGVLGRLVARAAEVVGEAEHPLAQFGPAPAAAHALVVADRVDVAQRHAVAAPVAARAHAGLGLP